MGDLNLSQYQTRVRLALNNLPSTDPYYTEFGVQVINDGANDLIKLYPDRFPEHHDRSWTIGPTTVGLNREPLPANVQVITDVRSADDQAIADPSSSDAWNGLTEHLVIPKTAEFLGRLTKSSTVTGYPRIYARKGNQLLFFPTVRTGYTTYLRLYGISGEVRLSAAGSTFRMNADYDQAVVLFAASKLATLMGRAKRAKELQNELSVVMGGTNVRARERALRTVILTSAYTPR